MKPIDRNDDAVRVANPDALDVLDDDAGIPARRRFLRAASAAALTMGGLPARADSPGGVITGFPLRPSTQEPITMLLRDLQPRYRPDLGLRPVYVPGLGGASAMLAVADAPPDGASALLALSSAVTLLPLLKKLPLDPATTLRPVAGIGELCYSFVVGPAVPADIKTMDGYLRWAQANPLLAQYGIPGRGTSPHFVGLEVARLSEIGLKSVGYQGMQPILQDVSNGRMAAAVTVLPTNGEIADHPAIRILAVSSGTRWPGMPDVPTLMELGLAEVPRVDSLGLFMASRTPDDKVADLRNAMGAALHSAPTIVSLRAIGLEVVPADFDYGAQIARERADWQIQVERRHFSLES